MRFLKDYRGFSYVMLHMSSEMTDKKLVSLVARALAANQAVVRKVVDNDGKFLYHILEFVALELDWSSLGNPQLDLYYAVRFPLKTQKDLRKFRAIITKVHQYPTYNKRWWKL